MRFADIHVRVAGDCTVREGHDIAHLVKNTLLEGDFHLADVVVHIEPETHEDAMPPPGLDDFACRGDEQVARFRAEDGDLVF